MRQKSANVSKRRSLPAEDERVRRTRSRIDAAFVELLHRRAYGNIRVSDITKKAHVGRATFYAHYDGKDELLRSQFDRRVAPMLASGPSASCPIDALLFFAHVGTSPQFYRAFMGADGGTGPRVLRECFEGRIRELLGIEATPDLVSSALPRFIASALLTTIECWLERGARETPQQVQALFGRLASPGLSSALAAARSHQS